MAGMHLHICPECHRQMHPWCGEESCGAEEGEHIYHPSPCSSCGGMGASTYPGGYYSEEQRQSWPRLNPESGEPVFLLSFATQEQRVTPDAKVYPLVARAFAEGRRWEGWTVTREDEPLENPSTIDSILFEKSRWTQAEAKRWLKAHGYRAPAADKGGPHAGYLRFRQAKARGRTRTITFSEPEGIKAVVSFTGRRNPSAPEVLAIEWAPVPKRAWRLVDARNGKVWKTFETDDDLQAELKKLGYDRQIMQGNPWLTKTPRHPVRLAVLSRENPAPTRTFNALATGETFLVVDRDALLEHPELRRIIFVKADGETAYSITSSAFRIAVSPDEPVLPAGVVGRRAT